MVQGAIVVCTDGRLRGAARGGSSPWRRSSKAQPSARDGVLQRRTRSLRQERRLRPGLRSRRRAPAAHHDRGLARASGSARRWPYAAIFVLSLGRLRRVLRTRRAIPLRRRMGSVHSGPCSRGGTCTKPRSFPSCTTGFRSFAEGPRSRARRDWIAIGGRVREAAARGPAAGSPRARVVLRFACGLAAHRGTCSSCGDPGVSDGFFAFLKGFTEGPLDPRRSRKHSAIPKK